MGHLGLPKRVATNLFILVVLIAVVAGSFPLPHDERIPLLGALARVAEPVLFQTGLVQQWDMFSTTPPRRIEQRLGIRAEITWRDGTHRWRDVVMIERRGFRARTHFSRLRRFFSELDRSPDREPIWRLLAIKIGRSESPVLDDLEGVRFVEIRSPLLTTPTEHQTDDAVAPSERTLRVVPLEGPGS